MDPSGVELLEVPKAPGKFFGSVLIGTKGPEANFLLAKSPEESLAQSLRGGKWVGGVGPPLTLPYPPPSGSEQGGGGGGLLHPHPKEC